MLSDSCPVLSVCDVGILWPNGWIDQDATWYGSRPIFAVYGSKQECVRESRGPCLLHGPNGWMGQDIRC